MTQEEFIEVLKDKGYSYKIKGDKIVVTSYGGSVDLRSLTSLPPGVEFNNGWQVDLRSLTSLPPGVEFNNQVAVYLKSLVGEYFHKCKCNIKGIDSNRLLNKMIKDGLFNKGKK